MLKRIGLIRKALCILASVMSLLLSSYSVWADSPILQNLQANSLEGNRFELRLKLSQAVPAPRSFTIENPARICLDFEGVKNGLSREQARASFNVGMVKRVLVVESGKRTRVIIDLNESVPFEVQMKGTEACITIAGESMLSSPAIAPFSGQLYAAEKVTNTRNLGLKAIDFRRGNRGEGRVIVDLNHANTPIDFKEEGSRIRIRFKGVLPSQLQRKLDVTDFGTPVTSINTVQQGSQIEMTIETNGTSENIAYQADKRFTVEVRPLTKEEKAEIQAKTFKYTGERLSLNFQDIEVRAVLQLIADFTGLNVVTSDTVTGSVTLRLRNVPWDEALDIILRTKGLAKRQVGDVLMIGPSEEMATREKLELQSRQQVQDLTPLRAEYIQVNYAKAADIALLLKTDKNSLLSVRGTVSVDERTNTLLVQDTMNKLEEIRALVNRLDIPIRQVLIESRIVFANDNFQDALGVSWGAAAKFRPGKEPVVGFAGDNTGSSAVALGAQPSSVAIGDRATVNLFPAITLPDSVINAGFGLTVAKLPGGTILDLELMALESEGLGKIVASPRLVTSNQQLAFIESGEEIPYLQSTSSGAASIAFKKAVLRLEVTPQITPDDHVIMDLKVNQDSRGVETAGVPAINTRQMQTKVLVANGETVVLGGIYQQTKNNQKDRVPFFGKLPVVGWAFRSESNTDTRNELMIFVTPKIIQEGMA